MLLSKCTVCDSKKQNLLKSKKLVKKNTFKLNSYSRSSFVLIKLKKLIQGLK